MIRALYLVLFAVLVTLSACKDEEGKADSRSENSYNVIFLLEGENKIYAGTVKGITACKYQASRYFSKHRAVIGQRKWEYVCCLRKPDNECAEEHKLD